MAIDMKNCKKELKKDLNKLLGIKNKTLVLNAPYALLLEDGDYLDAVVVVGTTTFKIGTTVGGGQIFDDTVTGSESITVDQYSNGGMTIYFSGYTNVTLHLLIQNLL